MEKTAYLLMITKVKNEADIIETFLRYHCNIFDLILVIDNGSIDGTYEIINKLVKEGLQIELINEAASDFDALRFANQYTAKYVKRTMADYVVFMDADEFLISDGMDNPRTIIAGFDKNKVHMVNWKTYIYNKQAEGSKYFDFNNFNFYRNENEETFTKIIVPGQLFLENKLIISEGNHNFKSEVSVETCFHDAIKFSHFPIRGEVQYRKQILLNSICMLSNPDIMKQTGSHWKKMFLSSKEMNDLEALSLHYAFYEGRTIIEGKFDDIFNTRSMVKYYSLIENDIEVIFLKYMSIQALKLKKERIKKEWYGQERKKLLVYGTGAYCDRMISRIDKKIYEIEAFVDSNLEKQFSTYYDKIIISPDKMRFFEFAYIIIASERYEKEIRHQIQNELPFLDMSLVKSIDSFIFSSYHFGE